MTKFLVCRPEGGLNDLLCQVAICARYAADHGRVLVVDTERTAFRDNFFRYFRHVRDEWIDFSGFVERAGEGRHVHPSAVQGRLSEYAAHWQAGSPVFVCAQTGVRLSFDFSVDHRSEILLHHACGGGDASMEALRELKLSPILAAELDARLGSLPGRL